MNTETTTNEKDPLIKAMDHAAAWLRTHTGTILEIAAAAMVQVVVIELPGVADGRPWHSYTNQATGSGAVFLYVTPETAMDAPDVRRAFVCGLSEVLVERHGFRAMGSSVHLFAAPGAPLPAVSRRDEGLEWLRLRAEARARWERVAAGPRAPGEQPATRAAVASLLALRSFRADELAA